MIRGTTPTFEFTLPFEVDALAKCYISFSQFGRVVLEKNIDEVTTNGKKISFKLTQEETLRFAPDFIQIQIRCVTMDGEALASNIMNTHASLILKDGVI